MYYLTELVSGESPPGAPWGSPYIRERPDLDARRRSEQNSKRKNAKKGEQHHGNLEQDNVL